MKLAVLAGFGFRPVLVQLRGTWIGPFLQNVEKHIISEPELEPVTGQERKPELELLTGLWLEPDPEVELAPNPSLSSLRF